MAYEKIPKIPNESNGILEILIVTGMFQAPNLIIGFLLKNVYISMLYNVIVTFLIVSALVHINTKALIVDEEIFRNPLKKQKH